MYDYEERSLSSNARQNFVKKVYSIISMQLLVTIAVVYLNFTSKSFARFQARNTWTFWLAFIGSLITLVALCKPCLTQFSEKSAEVCPPTTSSWVSLPSVSHTWSLTSAPCTPQPASYWQPQPPLQQLWD